MGFFGFALATTVAGDVVLPPSLGLDTVNGKSLAPLGFGGVQVDVGGEHAGGAGSALFPGDHVIATGGVEGYEGGVGDGFVALFMPLVPHAAQTATATLRSAVDESLETFPAASGATNRHISTHLGHSLLRWTDHNEREGNRTTAG